MSPIISLVARSAVAAYRREPIRVSNEKEETILRRLEGDPDGKVSAALEQLKPAHSGLIIFYVCQAADIAHSAETIVATSREWSDAYRDAAKQSRHLLAFCKGRAPIALWSSIVRLGEFLDSRAEFHADVPASLQIKRTAKTDSAPAIRALRHLGRILRSDFGIRRPPHDAVRWLVEAALGLNYRLPDHVVADSLRKQMGVRKPRKTRELPLSPNSLKRPRNMRIIPS
jgi:hypothetical protein